MIIIKQGVVDDTLTLRLAREIVMQIHELDQIPGLLGISAEQASAIMETDYFAKVYQAEKETWEAVDGTPARIKVKSLAIIEQSLKTMHDHINTGDEPLSSKNETLKIVTKLAGLDTKDGAPAPGGERFSVVINLGEKTLSMREVPMPVIEDTEYSEITVSE